jgi:hypothetical protein
LSLLGFLTCLGVMLAIDPAAGIVSISILMAVYHYLKRTAGPARWSDSSRGYHLQLVRENLLAAAEDPQHPRDWPPLILAMTNDPERRPRLLTFAAWIEGGSGLTGAVRMVEGEAPILKKLKAAAEKELSADIRSRGFRALPLVIGSSDILEAFPVAIQAYGIGPLKANTLLVNWFGQLGAGISGIGALYYADILRSAFRQGLNLVIFRADDEQWQRILDTPPENRRIDIWWRDDPTSRLMLLLAHLMRRDPVWADAAIRVVSMAREPDVEAAGIKMQGELEDMRIGARVSMVSRMDLETVTAESADAGMVFLPFGISNRKLKTHTGEALERLLPSLPATALVMAFEDIDLDAEPEEGVAADLAAAADVLEACQKKAQSAEKESAAAKEKAADLMTRLQDAEILSGLSPEELSELHSEAIQAIAASDRALRRAGKAKAKAAQAAREAEDMGMVAPEKP